MREEAPRRTPSLRENFDGRHRVLLPDAFTKAHKLERIGLTESLRHDVDALALDTAQQSAGNECIYGISYRQARRPKPLREIVLRGNGATGLVEAIFDLITYDFANLYVLWLIRVQVFHHVTKVPSESQRAIRRD